MAATPKLGKTGNAPIMKAGHTTSGRDGSDPNKQKRGGTSVRDLGIK